MGRKRHTPEQIITALREAEVKSRVVAGSEGTRHRGAPASDGGR